MKLLDVHLVRSLQNQWGTFGKLYVPAYELATCEDDYSPNLKLKTGSCIPAGVYHCTRTVYFKYGYETFWIHVPGWNRVLFHKGNTENDTRGCVLMGTRMGELDVEDEDLPTLPLVRKTAVVNSSTAFKRFMESLHNVDEFNLHVSWAPGLPREIA